MKIGDKYLGKLARYYLDGDYSDLDPHDPKSFMLKITNLEVQGFWYRSYKMNKDGSIYKEIPFDDENWPKYTTNRILTEEIEKGHLIKVE